MVFAFPESYRTDIEQEYGSIIEFKRNVHKAISILNQIQLQKAINEIYEADRKCAEAIIEGVKKIAESLTEDLQPVIKRMNELFKDFYEDNGFLPLNEDICIAPIPKYKLVLRYDKVPVSYSENIRTHQMPYRCRSSL